LLHFPLYEARLTGNRVQSHELISAQSGCEDFGRRGYDGHCFVLERDFAATEGQQRHARGRRRKSTRDIVTLIECIGELGSKVRLGFKVWGGKLD